MKHNNWINLIVALGLLASSNIVMPPIQPVARAASTVPSPRSPGALLTGGPDLDVQPVGSDAQDRTTPTPEAPPPPAGKGVEDTPVPKEIANVPGVTEDWWAQVQARLRSDLYAITAEQAEGEARTYRGYNPDQRFDFTSTAGGVRLAQAASAPEQATPEPGWTLELRTTGYGYQGDVRPLPALAETASDGNRLEFRHAGLTEWYVNDERGLEQGITLDTPPRGEGEVLVLELALDTGLAPTLVGDPSTGAEQVVEFTQPGGNVILLRYSDLYAHDAAGRALPAHMALSGCGGGGRPGSCDLQLVIDAAGAVYPLTIDPLVATPSWTAVGENATDRFGISVATAGDVNGDGYADLVVGASGYDGNRGKAYVYHGSPAGLGAAPAWTAAGEATDNCFGFSVATAGDVNGDGYADLVVGAYNYWTYSYEGKVYVYHGSPAGLGAAPAWTDTARGAGDDRFGYSVSSAGDVNSDGYDDLTVGATRFDCDSGYDCGRVYVYHGSPAGLVAAPTWTATGENAYDWFGASVATAGDVNGDGYADLVVGAPNYNRRYRSLI